MRQGSAEGHDPRGGRELRAALGALAFLVLVPGTVAGVVPFLISGWRQGGGPPSAPSRLLGGALVLGGLSSLLDSFVRFVVEGRGTPAPVAPPSRLVVGGQYRYVRNPMYLAVLGVVLGQALLLDSRPLLIYGTVLWLLFHLWVIGYEEPSLARRFGASYERYRRNVRRWRPRLTAWR